MLHGVDVHARYQAGLRASALAGVDFVITKATGGTSLVIDGWEGMLAGASLTGVYHYARENGRAGTAAEEAALFIEQAKKSPDAVLFLDWEESSSDLGDAAWVLEWMRLVEEGTGRKPVFYTYHAVLKAHPELSTIKEAGYRLWYARYPYSAAVGWKDYEAPTAPIWGKPLMWQYSSAGGIAGYMEALDLNIFYGDATDWLSLAAHTQKGETMTADADRQAVIATGRSLINSAIYSNAYVGATYSQFKSRRAGDCSDFTAAVFEPHGYSLPGMSWQQASAGTLVASWSGARGGGITAFNAIRDKLRPADIVCMSLQGSAGISHVNLNIDGVTALDHGGPGSGPRVLRYADRWLLGDATKWIVRRIIPDDKPGTITETTTATLDDLEEVIGEMKATHVIFESKKALYIANVLAGTFQKMRDVQQFKDRVAVLQTTGCLVAEWKDIRPNTQAKSNVVDNPSAWGIEVK